MEDNRNQYYCPLCGRNWESNIERPLWCECGGKTEQVPYDLRIDWCGVPTVLPYPDDLQRELFKGRV